MSKTIHAFRRIAAFTVDFTPPGARLLTLVRFAPNAAGDVIAEVANKIHAERLLNIPEAYREYVPEETVSLEEAPTNAQVNEQRLQALREEELRLAREVAASKRASELLGTRVDTPKGSRTMEEVISLTGSKTITQTEIILAAQGKSNLSIAEWNDLQDDEREALLSREMEHMVDLAEQEEDQAAEELRRQAALDEQRRLEEQAGKDAAKFVLVNGDTKIDLKLLDDKELKAFAKKYAVALPTGTKGDQIRQVLVDALVAAPEGADQSTAGGTTS